MTKAPEKPSAAPTDVAKPAPDADTPKTGAEKASEEIGGRGGLDPTRYGDWEKAGRCVDF
jgi:hypothetical protein